MPTVNSTASSRKNFLVTLCTANGDHTYDIYASGKKRAKKIALELYAHLCQVNGETVLPSLAIRISEI